MKPKTLGRIKEEITYIKDLVVTPEDIAWFRKNISYIRNLSVKPETLEWIDKSWINFIERLSEIEIKISIEKKPKKQPVAAQNFLPKYFNLKRNPPVRAYVHNTGLLDVYGKVSPLPTALQYLRDVYQTTEGFARYSFVLAALWGSTKPDLAGIISFFGFESSKNDIIQGNPLIYHWVVKNGVSVTQKKEIKADLYTIVSKEEIRINQSNANLKSYLDNDPYTYLKEINLKQQSKLDDTDTRRLRAK